MAFPPEFSSTEKYANRYDLDEIDVFLEGDASNPMFFQVSGLSRALTFGKHYFNLSLLNSIPQQYQLANNSKILFEFKSINNVVLRSQVSVKSKQKNGVATCFVEVLKDPLRTTDEILDGEGTLTIVGSLVNKRNTQNLIPPKYLGAMNYRCVFPINIRKNLINALSPNVVQETHTLSTIRGQFSFVKANIPTRKFAKVGNQYGTSGTPVAGTTEPDDRGGTS